jgi:HPt (histidine-containing phosphotransfer) domain-containing protein
MIPQRIIEGTGEEIAKYTQEHPNGRFQLIVLFEEDEEEETTTQAVQKRDKDWEDVMEFIHSWKGKLPIIPLEATSTEALYD